MEKIKKTLNEIAGMIERGEIPEVVALSVFPKKLVPCSKYSLLNRIIVRLSGTVDARGFSAWRKVKRSVKKGAKAIWIFAPKLKIEEQKNSDSGLTEKVPTLFGFKQIPVFRIEDTDGEPLPHEKDIKLPRPPPLMEVSERLGIPVKYVSGNAAWYGLYDPGEDSITLASPEETVFWHELAHAAHNRIERLKRKDDPFQEIVAELCAISVARIYGREVNGQSFRYISSYARREKKSLYDAVLSVISTAEKVLSVIFSKADTAAVPYASEQDSWEGRVSSSPVDKRFRPTQPEEVSRAA